MGFVYTSPIKSFLPDGVVVCFKMFILHVMRVLDVSRSRRKSGFSGLQAGAAFLG